MSGRARSEVPTALADQIDSVLTVAYLGGIAVNGDFYRYNAQVVAAAASMGLLTTETPEGYGRSYRVTQEGVAWVQELS